jgi:PAS domain S-box-containing protein
MTANHSPDAPPKPVEIPRSALRTSTRAKEKNLPLVRSREVESLDESVLEIPTPLTDFPDSQPVRILHVDDNPDITEVTSVFLEDINDCFEVTTETTVVEALSTLEEQSVDCIISDYQMPTTDGLEFLQIVREKYPDLPFILFTGQGSEEIASEAIAAGVTDYMQKGGGSDQYEVLSNRVQNAVERYRTQQQFWDALSWYQRLVEQNIAGVFVIQNEEIVYVNQKLADIFDYNQSDLIGDSPSALVVSGEQDDIDKALADSNPGDTETFQTEVTGRRQDGEEITVEVHGGTVEYNGDGALLGILREASQGTPER